jgi:hypothetical protein
MSVSILECLQNAQLNLSGPLANEPPFRDIAMRQLSNGITLLEKGYPLNTQVEPLLEKHGDAESVPDFE